MATPKRDEHRLAISEGAGQVRLAAWALSHDLYLLHKPLCAHGLKGRRITGVALEEHRTHCTITILGERPTLWSDEDGRPVVLIGALWVFRTGGRRREVQAQIRAYASTFNLAAWLGWPGHRLAFRGGGSSPVLYTTPADADCLPTDGRIR